jgi:hypothetical protein
MKKVIFINLFLLLLISCSKDEDDSLIVGTWNEIYVLGTIYDLQTGEIIGEHGYSANAIATFYNSGKLTWKMLGITSEGSYNISDNSLNIGIDSKTKSYTIEEFLSGKLILSTEEIDQGKQMREKIMRVFIKTDYQLTEDDIMKYTGPYPDWGVTRGR